MTSKIAYKTIIENGLLSKRRLEVYQILLKYGPLTAHEIVEKARTKYPSANQTGFNARLSELREMGVVEKDGEKLNKISGHNNIIWKLNDKLPKKLENKKSKDKIIKELKEKIFTLECTIRQEWPIDRHGDI